MRIREQFEDNKVHFKQEFIGINALELMIFTNVELYYGREIRNNIEKLLNTQIADEERNKQMNILYEKINSIQKRF